MSVSNLQAREAELARHRENRGRLAFTHAAFTSTGVGSVEFGARVDFGLTYIQKPWVSHGCEIDIDAVRDLVQDAGSNIDDDATPPLPQATGYVTDWDLDDRGNYIGCWVAVSVAYPASLPEVLEVEVSHYFTFAAVALKAIPLNLEEEYPALGDPPQSGQS